MDIDSPALSRLQERVHLAAQELQRLKSENAQLSESLRILWAKTPDSESGGASITFDGDRDELKETVQGYLEAIDRCLATMNGGFGQANE